MVNEAVACNESGSWISPGPKFQAGSEKANQVHIVRPWSLLESPPDGLLDDGEVLRQAGRGIQSNDDR